ncbi:MAG: glycosyl hydrolase family 28-related protein [Limisphaerales bacterium]
MKQNRLASVAGLLGSVMFLLGFPGGLAQSAPPVVEQRYPRSPFVVDVSQPPYSATGDGVTDDTDALQRVLNENVGRNRAIYFPPGTYLVSRTLTWPKRWNDRDNWGFTMLRGQHRDRTRIRLRDATFTNADQPGAIMWCGGFGSADWFHNYVENLTFDVGARNPGAIALQFYSNNSGAVRDCRFVAGEGSGLVGLDLAHRDMNGPLLVRHCEVTGFRRGITTGHSVNGQVFEHLTLRGQTEFGFDNAGQTISLRGFTSDNAVPALRSYGTLTLIEANLTGRGAAEKTPAIINYNGGRLLLRDITTAGYGRALSDVDTPDFTAAFRVQEADRPGSEGPDIAEYFSAAPTRLFPTVAPWSRLAVKETPDSPWDDPNSWANVDDFGADPTGRKDSAASIQRAMDSGAGTVFLPGSYDLRTAVTIRGRVRRVVGLGGTINYGKGLKPDFRLVDGDAPVVFLEHFANIHGGLEIDTRRTVVLRSVQDCTVTCTAAAEGGELFFEDVVTHGLKLRKQRLWARQLNIENEGTHLVNDASDLWILGYKTERGGTLLDARGGGRSEVLGGFSYTTTAGKLAPMFVVEDSSVFAFFGEVCYNGDPFQTLVRETRGGETKFVRRGEGNTLPYIGTR